MQFAECFGGTQKNETQWVYELKTEVNGAFGGTNGGVLAAVTVNAARLIAPGRVPAGLDCRFIRSFRPGKADVFVTVLNSGKTLTTVSVDITNSEGKLCTRSTVSLVDPKVLAVDLNYDRETTTDNFLPYAEGKGWKQPKGAPEVPLINSFQPRHLGKDERGIATATRVLWDAEGNSAEAACIAADISVGPPVGSVLREVKALMPNPDIALRFCGEAEIKDTLTAVTRLERINAGLASTRIEVFSKNALIAVGVSSTTCIPIA